MFPDYQSLESNTSGEPGKANRSIPDRIITYGIDKVLSKEVTVLDLGCNRGYFGICLSPLIGHYTGIDADIRQLQHGIAEKKNKGYVNLTYNCDKYSTTAYGKFDIIICCAFHIYCGVSMEVFGKNLVDMLNSEGRLFLEGHPPGYHLPNIDLNEPENYWNPLNDYLKTRLNVVESKKVKDRELLRPFIHYQK